MPDREEQLFLVLTLVIGALVGLVVVAFSVITERLGRHVYAAADSKPTTESPALITKESWLMQSHHGLPERFGFVKNSVLPIENKIATFRRLLRSTRKGSEWCNIVRSEMMGEQKVK